MTWFEGGDAFAVQAVKVHTAITSTLMFMGPLWKSAQSEKSHLNFEKNKTKLMKQNCSLFQSNLNSHRGNCSWQQQCHNCQPQELGSKSPKAAIFLRAEDSCSYFTKIFYLKVLQVVYVNLWYCLSSLCRKFLQLLSSNLATILLKRNEREKGFTERARSQSERLYWGADWVRTRFQHDWHSPSVFIESNTTSVTASWNAWNMAQWVKSFHGFAQKLKNE